MPAEHAATQSQGSPAGPAPSAAQRCGDCAREFRPSAAGGAPRCPQCGSTRCRPLRRTVAGRSRSGAAPVEEDRFARVALWGSLITSEQFDACVAEQERRAAAGEAVPSLPQLLIDRGYLRPEHADAVFRAMTTRTPEQWRNQFGQIALRKEFITGEQLRECLEFQTKLVMSTGSAPFLGHILIEHGYMAEAQALAILKAQEQRHIGVLHDLEAELLPARARVAQLLRRHRRIVWSVLTALAIVVAATVGALAHAVASAPRVYELICDRCGHYGCATAGSLPRPCPHCGKGQMCTVLWCPKCGIEFPLKIRAVAGKEPWIEGCPKCGTLRHVELPPGFEHLKVRPPRWHRQWKTRTRR